MPQPLGAGGGCRTTTPALAMHEPARAAVATRFKYNMASRKTSGKKTSKRTVIEPHEGDKRYVRRNKEGEFKKEVDVGRSLAADRRSKAKTKVKKGQGDRGDVKR
jgi:hypothetical protein